MKIRLNSTHELIVAGDVADEPKLSVQRTVERGFLINAIPLLTDNERPNRSVPSKMYKQNFNGAQLNIGYTFNYIREKDSRTFSSLYLSLGDTVMLSVEQDFTNLDHLLIRVDAYHAKIREKFIFSHRTNTLTRVRQSAHVPTTKEIEKAKIGDALEGLRNLKNSTTTPPRRKVVVRVNRKRIPNHREHHRVL